MGGTLQSKFIGHQPAAAVRQVERALEEEANRLIYIFTYQHKEELVRIDEKRGPQ